MYADHYLSLLLKLGWIHLQTFLVFSLVTGVLAEMELGCATGWRFSVLRSAYGTPKSTAIY